MRMDIEDVKLDFVMSVYDAITKQIQQMDMKISILLSWNGVVAVLLGREITSIFRAKLLEWDILALVFGIVFTLIVSGLYCYRVLKPRSGEIDNTHVGLLWSGDILKLGKKNEERISQYMNELLHIDTHDKLYEQFVKSIVLISDIQARKNRMFIKGLIVTVVGFTLLVGLIAIVGVKMNNLRLPG